MPPPHSADFELAILRKLWRRGRANVREVHGDLLGERSLGYTRVLKSMQLNLPSLNEGDSHGLRRKISVSTPARRHGSTDCHRGPLGGSLIYTYGERTFCYILAWFSD